MFIYDPKDLEVNYACDVQGFQFIAILSNILMTFIPHKYPNSQGHPKEDVIIKMFAKYLYSTILQVCEKHFSHEWVVLTVLPNTKYVSF